MRRHAPGQGCQIDSRATSKTGGCFARGTLVHTRDGLKPIQEVRVGDHVLSGPENGSGRPGYKQVVKVFVHHEKTIRKVSTYGPQSSREFFVAATGNHLFWVEGGGWTRADQLDEGAVLWRADGTQTKVASQWPIFRTDDPGVGWVQAWGDLENAYGSRFDYGAGQPAAVRTEPDYLAQDVYESDDPHLRVTVYDIEVEDWHTYYVGVDGLRVRDAK